MTTTTETEKTETKGKANGKAHEAAAALQRPYALEQVPLDKLHESPFNRRRTWGNLEELADSMRKVGVLEDLAGRPHPTRAGHVELAFGHRRLRGAKLAKLATVPVKVRDLSDQEVIEIQAIENLQREDVHPIEEAETYELLRDKNKLSVEQIAERISRPTAYVYQRLKLLDLCKEGRQAFVDAKLSASVALYVARIPHHDLQRQALKDLDNRARQGGGADDPVGAREAHHLITGRYMLRLADAPFDRGDATLVPKAGTCKACPKRTGNQRALFDDVKTADTCTDPTCFAAKRKAHVTRERKAAETKGVRVVDGQANKWDDRVTTPDGYVQLSANVYEVPYGHKSGLYGKTYGALLKAAKVDVEPVVMFDHTGTALKLASKATVASAVKALGIKSGASVTSAHNKKHKTQQQIDRRTLVLACEQVVAKAERKPLDDAQVRYMVLHGLYSHERVAARRGWDLGKQYHAQRRRFEAHVNKLRGAKLRGLLVEMLAADHPGATRAVCALYHVDYGALARKATAEIKAKAAAKKAGKAKGK